MILKYKENPRHFFECQVPPIGEETWVDHFKYPIRVSNYGRILPHNPEYQYELQAHYSTFGRNARSGIYNGEQMQWNSKVMELPGQPRLVLEAYTGEDLKNIQITNLNFNILDNRPENLVPVNSLSYQEKAHRKIDLYYFVENTIDYMHKLANRLGPDTDKIGYFKLLRIPKGYIQAYKHKYQGAAKKPFFNF